MPVPISRADARRLAMACRGQAFQIRQSAEKVEHSESRAIKLFEATELERLADLFDQHARSR